MGLLSTTRSLLVTLSVPVTERSPATTRPVGALGVTVALPLTLSVIEASARVVIEAPDATLIVPTPATPALNATFAGLLTLIVPGLSTVAAAPNVEGLPPVIFSVAALL